MDGTTNHFMNITASSDKGSCFWIQAMTCLLTMLDLKQFPKCTLGFISIDTVHYVNKKRRCESTLWLASLSCHTVTFMVVSSTMSITDWRIATISRSCSWKSDESSMQQPLPVVVINDVDSSKNEGSKKQ
jgi:hypothetical protein